MHANLHLPHLHGPHPDLRHLARDAAIAAEVVLASVVLTGSIKAASHMRTEDSTTSAPAPAVALSTTATVALTVSPASVAVHDGVRPTAEVQMPSGGELTLQVVDASGAVVQATGPITETSHVFDLPAGSYRVVASRVGPVETVGEASIASSTVVRSEPFELTTPGSFVVNVARLG